MKTSEERKAILNAEVIKQQKKGWQITSRTDTTCQLAKEKKPETVVVVILILLFVIPGILYLIFMKGNVTVYVEINEEGDVKYSGKDLSPFELDQLKTEYVDSVVEGRKLSPYEIEMKEKALAEEKQIAPTTQVTIKATNDLGLLTASSIAEGLKVLEDDVIKLIKANELKGKKIGDKYFVRKEDFDAFMGK